MKACCLNWLKSCLRFDLEKLAALLLKERCFQKIPPTQKFMSVIERKSRTGLCFSGLNFNGFSFGGVELSECEVTDCDLSNLVTGNKWIKTTFTKCNFSNSKVIVGFIDCAFKNCTFTKSKIEIGSSCSLTDCTMNEIEIVIQDCTKFEMINCELSGSSISNDGRDMKPILKVSGCKFTNAKLKLVGIETAQCNLTISKCKVASIFTGIKMDGMDFCGSDLSEFDFINVEFKGINFSKCKMGRLSKQTFSI